jgi:hypothetical protein
MTHDPSAVIVAREILERYPTLRGTWPVRRARAWRDARAFRLHPRRMASWFRDAVDMHTRVFISNLELPEAPELCRSTAVNITLFDHDGAPASERRFTLKRNGSLALELGALLPARLRGHAPSGQVRMDFEGPQLGSSRAYLHWYNAHSLTSSHEKFGLTIPAVAGYWTVPNVRHGPDYVTHLAITNLDEISYSSTITLKASDGRALTTSVDLPPNGSRFAALHELFDEPAGFLGPEPGILYFGNADQPAMYYYFVANQQLGTWRAQHL